MVNVINQSSIYLLITIYCQNIIVNPLQNNEFNFCTKPQVLKHNTVNLNIWSLHVVELYKTHNYAFMLKNQTIHLNFNLKLNCNVLL